VARVQKICGMTKKNIMVKKLKTNLIFQLIKLNWNGELALATNLFTQLPLVS